MIRAELDRLIHEPVSEEEILRSKNYLIGRHDIDLQRISSVNASMLFDEIYGVPFDETFQYKERIQSLHSKEVQVMAQKIFTQAPVISIVGRS